MNITGAIFDFDGTLFDSMSIWETAGKAYLASLGKRAEPGLSRKLKPMSLMQAAEYLKAAYGLSGSVSEIMDGVNKTVEAFYLYRAQPKAGAAELLDILHRRGVKLCIATATDRPLVEAALKRCDLLRYFAAIFTCTEAGCGKDDPAIFHLARSALGTKQAETAVFEDAYHAARTAKAAGYFVIGVYDRYEPETKALQALADRYLADFSEATGEKGLL